MRYTAVFLIALISFTFGLALTSWCCLRKNRQFNSISKKWI